MGCLVAKSTISYYEGEINKTTYVTGQVKQQIEDRKQFQPLNELSQDEQLGYLAYQEQLRTEYILNKLKDLFHINEHLQHPDEHFLSNLSAYSDLKYNQTHYESKLIDQLYTFFEELKTMNSEKKSAIDQQISEIERRRTKTFKSSKQLLHSLTRKLTDVEGLQALEKHVQSFVKRAEIDKEIALLERIYEFKGYLAKEGAKKLSHNDGAETVKTLKNELKEATKALAFLKAEEQKYKQAMKEKKKEVRKKEETLQKLAETRQELEDEIKESPDVVNDFEELLKQVTEKEMLLKQLQNEVETNEKKLQGVRVSHDIEDLKQASKNLKRQIEEVEHQVDEQKSLKMKRIQEKIRQKHQDLESKSKKIQDLKQNIKNNQDALAKAEADTKFQLKKQVMIRLIRSIKRLRSNFFRSWKRNWLQLKIVLPSLDELSSDSVRSTHWQALKLFEFFDMFIQEKVRSDKARIHNKKLPKTTSKYLLVYMKRLYKSTNECEKELNRMMLCIYSELKAEPLAFIIKKMVSPEQSIPYHLDILLTQLWNEYNYYANLDPAETFDRRISFFDTLKIVQDYLSPEYQAAGQKLVLRLKPEAADYEDLLILVLKNILTIHDQESLLSLESSQNLSGFLIDQCQLFIEAENLKKYLSEYSGQTAKTMLRYLNLTVSKFDESLFSVRKSDFFCAVIDLFEEFLLQARLEVEKRVRSIEEVQIKDFEKVLKELEPGLEEKYLEKVLNECLIDENSNLYSVSRDSFAEVVIKYGLGGLGVGPFRTNEIKALLERFLAKGEKVNFSRRQSSDLVPYKINVERIEIPANTSQLVQRLNILDILPSKNLKLHNIRRADIRSPSPSGNRVSKPTVFFSSRSNSPFRADSPVS